MGAFKSIATKKQHGLNLNNDEKRFMKVFSSKAKAKFDEVEQLELFRTTERQAAYSDAHFEIFADEQEAQQTQNKELS